MAQLLLHLANITIYENPFITDSRKFIFPWEFPGIPDLLFPFPGNSATIHRGGEDNSGRLGQLIPLLVSKETDFHST